MFKHDNLSFFVIESCHPYILATLPKCIEVWSREPRALIQRIDLGKARSITQGPNCYISSSSHVWRLVPVSINKQIQQLVEDKQFEVALSLAVILVVVCFSTNYFICVVSSPRIMS